MDLMLYSYIYDVHLISGTGAKNVVSSHLWKLYFFIKVTIIMRVLAIN